MIVGVIMQIDKQALADQIYDVIYSNPLGDWPNPGLNIIRSLAEIWNDTIKTIYGDDTHNAIYFMDKIDKNNEQASLFFEDRSPENEEKRRTWLIHSVNIIDASAGGDFMAILRNIEMGGSLDLNNPKNHTNAIIFSMRNKDVVVTSLGLLLSTNRGSVTLPRFGEEFAETNTLFTAVESSTANLKMLISRYPKGCLRKKNRDALDEWVKKQPMTQTIEKNKQFYDETYSRLGPTDELFNE